MPIGCLRGKASTPPGLAFAFGLALWLCGALHGAWATAYTFPGSMPAGCSGSNGSYSCTALTLAGGDTVTIGAPTPATLTVNGDFTTNNAQINASGSAGNLTLVVSGILKLGYQAKIVANITAGSVNDTNGGCVLGGSITTTTGTIAIAYGTSVAGSITTTTGSITLTQANNVGGNVTSTSGSISIGYGDVVSGSVSTSGAITTGQSSQVAGSLTGGSGAIGIGYAGTVTGAITSSTGAISFAQNSVASACVKSTGSASITLGSSASVKGVCCGSGACNNSCVVNNSGSAMPALCTGAAATLLAEYHFEDSSAWNGTAGELKDSAGATGGPYNGTAQGPPLPSAAATSPARTGTPGTCGYASLSGPVNTGAGFVVSGLPVSSSGGTQTSLAFWMYWAGLGNNIVVSWSTYGLWLSNGYFGFSTSNSDLYGAPSSGLANGWHHVVAVFTNGSVTANQLYIDGTAQTLSQRIGSPNLGKASVVGPLQVSGYAASSATSQFTGQIDELRVYNGAVSTQDVAYLYTLTHTCAQPNHLEIRHSTGSGVTCTPSTLTIAACQDSACSTPYVNGVSGTLTATGTGMTTNWPNGAAFSIPVGSSTTTQSMQVTTAGSVLLGASGISPATTNATTCNFGSPSCTFTTADSGFLFDVPNHVADTAQTVSVTAVRKSDSAAVCVPAFASVSKSVTFTCAYQNPGSGTLPVRVGGSALNAGNSSSAACDASGRAVSLAFNASGVASTSVLYADAGQMQLNARYAGSSGGEVGLVMTGTDTFVAAPASFAFSGITAGPIKAGAAFAATVTARNTSGNTTPNFGRESSAESATLAFTRAKPTGTGASNGSFTGSLGAFSSGVASSSTLVWSDVGYGDLKATLASGSYLGSGFTATGTTGSAGAVGRFIPHHFVVAVTPACSAGSFSYAGQPFTAKITAMNGLATPGTTLNYDGSSATSPTYAQAVTLSDAGALGVGSFGSTGTVAASAFTAGTATTVTPAYTYTNKLTGANTLAVRATDTDAVSSSGYAEGTTVLRSGRLRLSNAFGSEKSTLAVSVQVQYWSGNAWVPNSADTCTVLPAGAVALSGTLDNRGAPTSGWSTSASAVSFGGGGGTGTLTLSAPNPTTTGSVDLALNLGSSATDQSCLSGTRPASIGAALPWLRSQQGNCATTWDRDPAARASFGIYAPETKKTLHVREVF